MGVTWTISYMLICIPVIVTYNSDHHCIYEKMSETTDCNHFQISKLKVGKYPVNSTSLKHLYINNAGLKEIDYNVFQSMRRLEIIDLKDNLIESLDYRLFLNLKNLYYLYLSRNKLYRLADGRLFQDQYNLVYLDLSMNKLVFLNSSVLKPLRTLKNLKMSKNTFVCNCELWKTIIWCKNKSLETDAVCEKPKEISWSYLDSKNKCPFTSPPTEPNKIVLIVCIIFAVIFIVVCIVLVIVILYCRNRRRKKSHKTHKNANPNIVKCAGKETMMDTTRKNYLSIIPEGTEGSSRVPSSSQLDMDSDSVVFEELDECQLAMFEAEIKATYVNFPPMCDSMNDP